MTAFQRAAGTQVRVIYALLLRDLVAEGGASRSLPFLKLYLRPMVIIGALYVAGRATGLSPADFPLLIFIITGYLVWIAFVRCFMSISIRGSLPLLMFPQVTPLDLILGKIAVQFVLYTTLFVILSGLGMLFEQASPPADPLGVMLAFWSAIGLGLAMGLIVASISRFTTLLDDFFVLIRNAGHAASGVFALATDTPTVILDYLRWNPLFHAVEWMRESWWSNYKSPIADPAYVFYCLFFLIGIGLAFERASRRWQSE